MFLTVTPSTSLQSFEVVGLTILASDADFVGLFDCIEVWRSRETEGGPYEELTGSTWRGARLPRSGLDQPAVAQTGPNVNVTGLVLELLINEKDLLAVEFTGVNPLTLSQVATQITTQSLGRLRAWVDTNAQLVIETTEPGTGATLRVISSDTASFLGLTLAAADALAFGQEARILLVAGTGSYSFSDKGGSSAYFYRTRLRNRSNNTVSEFGQTYNTEQVVGINPVNVVTGYLDLVDSAGRNLVGIEVSLRSPFIGSVIEGKLVAGSDLMQRTDAQGHVEFTLMRGQTYTLSIAGTNIAKEIVAPTDTAITSFLLVDDAFATQDDYFRARVPQIPTMERRSL